MGTISSSAVSVSDALFPKVRQQVLGILYGATDRSFYSNELIRLARTGIGAVQRELQSLSDAGLITVERRGNQKHYQANAASPLFSDLKSIVAKIAGIPERLQSALAPLSLKIAWALLYGSAAKGALHSGSDVDVMVVSDQLTLEQLFQSLAACEEALGRKINPTLYTSEEFRKRRQSNNSFLKKVLTGPHVDLIGSEDAIA